MLYWYKVNHLLLRRCKFYYVISIVAILVLMFHILPLHEIMFGKEKYTYMLFT